MGVCFFDIEQVDRNAPRAAKDGTSDVEPECKMGSIPTSGVLFAQVPFGLHAFCWLLTMVFLLILTPKKRGARD